MFGQQALVKRIGSIFGIAATVAGLTLSTVGVGQAHASGQDYWANDGCYYALNGQWRQSGCRFRWDGQNATLDPKSPLYFSFDALAQGHPVEHVIFVETQQGWLRSDAWIAQQAQHQASSTSGGPASDKYYIISSGVGGGLHGPYLLSSIAQQQQQNLMKQCAERGGTIVAMTSGYGCR